MSTQVAGILADPLQRPIANAVIEIRPISASMVLLPGAGITAMTNGAGEYNFILEPASYAVSVRTDGRSVWQGAILVTTTTPPSSLPELINQASMDTELPSNIREYFNSIQTAVKEDADRAQQSASSVGDQLEMAQKAASDAAESASDADEDRAGAESAYQATLIISGKFQNLDAAVTQTQQNAQQTQSDATKTSADRAAADSAAQRAEDAANSAETVNERNLRVPPSETINALPAASMRVNSVAAFDSNGASTVKKLSDFAPLDSSGKVPLANIPAAAITEVFPVSSQAAMLALQADPGDVAIINNASNPSENGSFILMGSPATAFANWKYLSDNILVQLGMGSGASKVGLQPSGDGFVLRNVADRLLDRVSVKDFGAKGDGDTDDTAAIQKAITQNKGRIYFPAGNYIVSSQLNFNQADVMIRGESRSSTSVTFTGTGTLFSGVFTDSIRFFEVSDIRVLCTTLAQATAFYFEWPENFEHGLVQRGSVRNVSIRGANEYEQGFNICFHCHQGDNINFIDCEFKGAGGSTNVTQAYNTRSSIGVQITGRYSPVEYRFIACYFGSLNKGVDIGDTAEGIYFSDCIMISVKTAVYWVTGIWSPNWPGTGGQSASGRPFLSIKSCHMHFYQYGVFTNGVVSIHQSGNVVYHNENALQNGGGFVHANATEIFTNDCETWAFNSTYYLDSIILVENVSQSTIENIRGVGAAANSLRYGVDIRNGCKNNIIKNVIRRGNTAGQLNGSITINDASGGLNSIGIRGGLFYSTGAQSVPSGPITVVNFGARDYDPEGVWSGAGGNLVVPSGVQRVRLSGAVLFDSGSTSSARELFFLKNGASAFGLGQQSVTSVSGKGTYLNVDGAVISVNAGDVLTMNVRHDDGVNRTLVANLCWAQMEIIQ